ncbi:MULTISPECIES: hypothetical protein [Mesorhizobium]|uniref:hypothetical protein n=1 Tax=unclassified Mesorhizobium TaxID=325217 RepID=UPI00315A394A
MATTRGHFVWRAKARAAASCGRAIQGVRALASFDLGELLDDHDVLGISEARDRGTLGLDAQA